LKAGIQSALQDIKNNHPNDLASLIYFSSLNSYNTARVPMGKLYDRMRNTLFFPYSLINATGTVSGTMRPYNTTAPNNSNPSGLNPYNYEGNSPLSAGGTNPTMGLMVAYNQFNWSGGYTGRNGASKVVILETDGVANQFCQTAQLTAISGSGGRAHWTSVNNTGSSNGHPDALDSAVTLAWMINQDSGGTKPWPTSFPGQAHTRRYTTWSGPGFSSSRLPAQVHALAFGELFEPATALNTNGATRQNQALRFLLDVQFAGGTSPAGATSIESYKIITGTYTERIDKIRQALERIMQGGVQVALVQ
jgi:hypothetical protein